MSEALKLCIKNRRIMRKAVREGKKRKAKESELKSLEKNARKAAKEAKDQKKKEWKEERDTVFGKFRRFSGRGKEILEVLGEIEERRGKEDHTELLKEGRVVRGWRQQKF